jgi:hypothetical protein
MSHFCASAGPRYLVTEGGLRRGTWLRRPALRASRVKLTGDTRCRLDRPPTTSTAQGIVSPVPAACSWRSGRTSERGPRRGLRRPARGPAQRSSRPARQVVPAAGGVAGGGAVGTTSPPQRPHVTTSSSSPGIHGPQSARQTTHTAIIPPAAPRPRRPSPPPSAPRRPPPSRPARRPPGLGRDRPRCVGAASGSIGGRP